MVVIEHNLDVIWNADHVIDLGPEGGDLGGMVTIEGSPQVLSKIENHSNSHTTHFLYKSQR